MTEPTRIHPEDSDTFFNHPDVVAACGDAVARVGCLDGAIMAPALVVAARRLIESGDLSERYSPELYARDFLDRI